MTIKAYYHVIIPMDEETWNSIDSDDYYNGVIAIADGRPYDLDQEIGYDWVRCESVREAMAIEVQIQKLIERLVAEGDDRIPEDDDDIPF